jgi:hypothetical protein
VGIGVGVDGLGRRALQAVAARRRAASKKVFVFMALHSELPQDIISKKLPVPQAAGTARQQGACTWLRVREVSCRNGESGPGKCYGKVVFVEKM